MKPWEQLADDVSIKKAIEGLVAAGIDALVVDNAAAARAKVLEILPQGAEVMNMSSVTLETLGLDKEINESGNYNSVKNKLKQMDRTTQGLAMQKLGAAPEWTVGSVHAVSEDGQILIASNTGSQLPAYAYTSAHVIWVVGTQKIVADLDEARKRVYEYCLPTETKHVQEAYGWEGSNVSKLLLISKEKVPHRLTLIFVKEKLGF
ncbi:MAG: LUD domain-containing protein [Patescibacteria group bacterium]|nr:LUD domain-containing protein [Patescibacteria group bacterium]